jgi:hypothetical protein
VTATVMVVVVVVIVAVVMMMRVVLLSLLTDIEQRMQIGVRQGFWAVDPRGTIKPARR